MSIFSFHTAKNIRTLGEGGTLVIDDSSVVPRLKEFRQSGHDNWGANYNMTEVQAAVGLVQLRKLDSLIAARRLAQARTKMLQGCPELQPPSEPEGCEHSYYLYSILVSPA